MAYGQGHASYVFPVQDNTFVTEFMSIGPLGVMRIGPEVKIFGNFWPLLGSSVDGHGTHHQGRNAIKQDISMGKGRQLSWQLSASI